MGIEDNDRAVDAPDEGAEPQEVSIRDALEASVEAHGEQDDAREPAPEREERSEEREDGRERDESGRFKARDRQDQQEVQRRAQQPLKPGEAQPLKPGEAERQAAQAQPTKAPQSWKPALREKWGTLPADVQAEITRRETEIARTMQESADARRGFDQYRQVTQPYDQWIRAQGMEAPQMVANLLNMATTLQFAPRERQAKLLADLWRNFMGTDEGSLRALDAEVTKYLPKELGGQGQGAPPPAFGPQDVARLVQQQLDQRLQQGQQQQHQQLVAGYKEDLVKFAESHDFYADVKPTMLKLMESGLAADFEEAYEKAVALHPDVSGVLAQREQERSAAKANASTQRSVRAARSIKPSGSTPAHAKPPATEIGDILREKFGEAEQR